MVDQAKKDEITAKTVEFVGALNDALFDTFPEAPLGDDLGALIGGMVSFVGTTMHEIAKFKVTGGSQPSNQEEFDRIVKTAKVQIKAIREGLEYFENQIGGNIRTGVFSLSISPSKGEVTLEQLEVERREPVN